MTFETIRIEGQGPVRHLVLNRPRVHNAINPILVEEVAAACRTLDRLGEVRVVILRGEGKSFCSGADLKAPAESATEALDRSKAGARMADLYTNLSAVTIACLHGYCIGGGAVLGAISDFRLAAPGTSLTINEVSIGFNLTWHTLPAIIQLVGAARAKEMVLLGRTYGAEQLLAYGFVNEVVPADALIVRAEALAAEVCHQPPLPAFATKASINAYSKALDRSVQHMDHLAVALMSKSENSRIAQSTYFSKGPRIYVEE